MPWCRENGDQWISVAQTTDLKVALLHFQLKAQAIPQLLNHNSLLPIPQKSLQFKFSTRNSLVSVTHLTLKTVLGQIRYPVYFLGSIQR